MTRSLYKGIGLYANELYDALKPMGSFLPEPAMRAADAMRLGVEGARREEFWS